MLAKLPGAVSVVVVCVVPTMYELFAPANIRLVENTGIERIPFEPIEASKVIGPVELGNPSSHG